MDRVTSFVCPHCTTAFRSAAGMEVGKKARCPYCLGRFIVCAPRADDSSRKGAERRSQLNRGRLVLAVLGVLLYLLGGAVLGFDCFMRDDPSYQNLWGGQADSDNGPKPPAPPAPPPPTTVSVSDEDQREIDKAIVKGVWYLRKAEIPLTTPGVPGDVVVGVRSLAALTLLECGVSGSEAVVQDAAKFVRQNAPQSQTARDTYQLALALLFLDRLGEKADEELIQLLALRLLAGQRTDDGGWSYTCPLLDSKATPTAELLDQLRDDKVTVGQWHTKALAGKVFTPDRSDNSNTQFAALALWVARRHGVQGDKAIALVDKHFSNHPDGIWWYCDADQAQANSSWPTMTCSGLLGLAVAHGVAQEAAGGQQKPLDNPVVPKALAVLAGAIDKPNPEADLYFLWSLERVAVLYRLSKIEDKDWYGWGSKGLLTSQREDGSWQGQWLTGASDVVSTCFALLFLKQANLVSDLSDKVRLLAK